MRTYSWRQIGSLWFLECDECGQDFRVRPMTLHGVAPEDRPAPA